MLEIGERQVVLSNAQLKQMDLKCFCDGNLGVVQRGNVCFTYGANGASPVRVRGTPDLPFQSAERVRIAVRDATFQYLAGGPTWQDPATGKVLLFYHAEVHMGTAKKFYSVLGLALQVDQEGLEFNDLGPVFRANLPIEKSERGVELCGAPFMVRDGYFHVYARDALQGPPEAPVNLSVARARVADVLEAAGRGQAGEWKKYYQGAFSEPAVGGRSTPLEDGNPWTRWFDVAWNTVSRKYLLLVAANTPGGNVELFTAWSGDGLRWSPRTKVAEEQGESFYPSIVDFRAGGRRECGGDFQIIYTHSVAGGWSRWSDAEVVSRRIRVAADAVDSPRP